MAESHDDRDAGVKGLFGNVPLIDSLTERARQLSEARLNEITAGKLGERVLSEQEVGGVIVRRMPDDEHGVLRLSIGGGRRAGGFYCVYRGNPNEIIEACEKALAALRSAAVVSRWR